jgi:hypothetical protein
MADARRVDLHNKLCAILGSSNVYFQPPESIRMKYPAIVYNLTSGSTRYASNGLYMYRKRYDVTVMDKNPDANWDKTLLSEFEYCSFERAYAADNINHWQFSLYY